MTIIFVGAIFWNVHFTSGSVNSLIFFAQVIDMMHIDVNGLIKSEQVTSYFKDTYLLFYRMFNLEFFTVNGLSYCIMENAMALDVLAFKYLTITYSLIFVLTCIAVLKLCNPCTCLKRYFSFTSYKQFVKESAIHGLVAILVMCYSQCTAVSLSILTPGYIYWRGTVENRTTSKVVYLSGDLTYFGDHHLRYAIPAIIFIITITILPPFCLIVYPLCYKLFAFCHVKESSITKICHLVPFERMKPLFDSVQGCFKDQYRFFGGLYFLYRFIILICFTATKRPIDFYTSLEIQLIATIVLHAIIQPYQKQWHNMMDVSLLSLLAIINTMTIYNYHTLLSIERELTAKTINIVSALQTVLAYIPLTCLLIYCILKTTLRCKGKCTKQKYTCENEIVDTLTLTDYRELNSE